MHFFRFAAAWLFPCAVFATLATTAAATATDSASVVEQGSTSSPAFSAGGVKEGADPASSPSAVSTTSSSTSSLLDTRTRCGSPINARSPEKQGGAATEKKGDTVRRCLRRLAKKLQRAAGADDDERPDGRRERRRKNRSRKQKGGRGAVVVGGTAWEREEAVASAIAYCKETMSRRSVSTSPSPPPPIFDGWILDHPDEIGSACADVDCKCPTLRRDVSLLDWLPEAPARTSSAAVQHHRGCASFDEYGGKSAAETEKRASRRCLTEELGVGDSYGGLDIDVSSV